jgi:hypothetical protein
VGAHFIDGEGQAHAAFGVGGQFLELALAAAAGVDLRLHHIKRAGQAFSGFDRLVHGENSHALSDGGAKGL